MKNITRKLWSLLLAAVMVTALVPTAGAASVRLEPTPLDTSISTIDIKNLDRPFTGNRPDTKATVSDHVTVQSIYWWLDSSGNGVADEENCTDFKKSGTYYCRIILVAADGYTFANKSAFSRHGVVYQYTGTITVNGETQTGTFYTSADGTTITFDWWKDAAIEGDAVSIDESFVVTVVTCPPEITRQPQSVEAQKGDNVLFTVAAESTKDLRYQWYILIDGTPSEIGPNSPRLAILNAFDTYEEAQVYCVVSNGDADTTSDVATLKQAVKTIETPVTPEVPGTIIKRPVFKDVKADAYYNEPVGWAVEKGITNGTSETTFSPDNTCTRAQIVTFLWRAAGSPEPQGGCPFSDVPAGSYYEKAVTWAAEQGMADGDQFYPNDPCTRLMAVEFMWAQAGRPQAAAASFTDVNSEAVNWAVKEGVTNGTSATRFSPASTCTRGQIVTFQWRAFGK